MNPNRCAVITAIAAIMVAGATACATETPAGSDTTWRQPMTQSPARPGMLTGQDVGEAQGALDALLDDALAGTGVNASEYVILRVLAAQGPQAKSRAFYEYLVGQRQLKLDMPGAIKLVHGLAERGLVSGASPDAPGPVALTDAGTELNKTLATRVAPISRQVFADMNSADLETTHRVLRDVINRARSLRSAR
jgi:hypothetical protein